MLRTKAAGLIAASLLATTVAAFAYGKVGLWNVTTTTKTNLALDADTIEEMKKAGIKMPGAQAITGQTCMTAAEVKSGASPMQSQQMKCDSHITSQTASSMTADGICKGEAQGTTHLQMSWTSPEHYQGTYTFKGSIDGNPTESTSDFKGDWVKADCGGVKPQTGR